MRITSIVPPLTRDGKLVVAASTIRALGYGFLSVFLGIYLNLLEFTPLQAGLVFSGIMAGGALSNSVASWKGDAIGRRRMLLLMSGLMVLGGILFPFVSGVGLLVIVGLFAMMTSTGSDRTAFLSLDMAILAQATGASHRTAVFTWYNLLRVGAKALGVLLIAVPPLLQRGFGIEELASFKLMFGAYSLIAFAIFPLYLLLSPRVEPKSVTPGAAHRPLQKGPRGTILRLAGLFSLDSLGGGFMLQSMIAFWFVNRFGIDLSSIAGIFFIAALLNVVSVTLAGPVASRFGLVRTIAWSQAIANLMIIGMALSPAPWLAVALFLGRELANDMDVPIRQSYVMAIVPLEATTSAASLTNLGRNVAHAVGPGIAGSVAQATFLAAPFLIGGGIKLAYNAALYFWFRGIKAPEELSMSRDARTRTR